MRSLLRLPVLSKFEVNSFVQKLEKYPQTYIKSYTFYIQRKSLIVQSVKFNAVTNIQLHSIAKTHGKYFQEVENEYAHAIMEKLPGYSPSMAKFSLIADNKNSGKSSENNVFDEFAKVTVDNLRVALNLENEMFSELIRKICASLSEASDEDVQRTLHYLCFWPPAPKTYTPHFKAVWNTLDAECTKRLKHWNVNHKLLIADYWSCLKLSRISQYNSAMIYDLIEKIDSLSTQQIVQLMFYINLQRKIPYEFLRTIERQLILGIDSMSVEEVGIICLGFFKTETKIYDFNLIQGIAQQLIRNVESVNHVTVAAILKCLRKSFYVSMTETYISILHRCIPFIKNWDIPTSIHLGLLSAAVNVYHPLLLNAICEKFFAEISDSRIKDCAKLLHCLSQFGYYYKKELHNLILSEVKKKYRKEEIYNYPEYVVHLALYYAYFGEFNNDLLSIIFQKSFIQCCLTNKPQAIPPLAEIDYCVEIEYPDYSGPKFDKGLRKVRKNYQGNLPNTSKQQSIQAKFLKDIYDCLLEILGCNKNICIKHILPHFYTPDIIIRLSSKNEKPLSEICQDFPSDVILIPPSNELWACIVVGGYFAFAHRSKQITGITTMKLRQLRKIGYNVIFIPHFDFPVNITQRRQFLKEKLDILESKI